jgi:hypothetical protein
MNMTTDNAEALRAATEAVRLVREAEADQRRYGTYGGVEEAQQFAFNMLARHGDTFLAALASQPQAAGVGGDAVYRAKPDGSLAIEGDGKVEVLPIGYRLDDPGTYEFGGELYVLRSDYDALAATPAPAVEACRKRIVGYWNCACEACAAEKVASHITTPPAEAREPEPRGAVDAARSGEDAERFAWYFTWTRTTSHAMTDLMLRSLHGEQPTLDQWRDAIDAARTAAEQGNKPS